MSRRTSTTRPFLELETPLAFAHRGGAACWPENTLLAFEKALQSGCPLLETDLHMTRDGVIVAFHDDTLERTTDGRGPIWTLDWRELQALDAGYRFSPDGGETFPYRGKGLRVPALHEVMALGPQVRVNAEIKQGRPAMVAALWDVIESSGYADRILVAAAHHPLVREFRRLSGSRVATSASVREVLQLWLAVRARLDRFLPIEYDALQVPVKHSQLTVVERRFVEAAHRHGLQVHVWTVDDPDEMRSLLDLGVDGLMSDYPERLVEVVSTYRPAGPPA
jgi:glycerophosphoryl diester phosphodiesterase